MSSSVATRRNRSWPQLRKALQAGTTGYVLKGATKAVTIHAVTQAPRGQQVLHRTWPSECLVARPARAMTKAGPRGGPFMNTCLEPTGESPPARLLIVDDHELARAGLRSLLADEARVEVIGEATTGREALALCRRLRPDL